MSIALAISPIESVFGQNSNLGLGIIQVVPAGSTVNDGTIVSSGSSDELLNLQGTIYTANSTYQIIFNSEIVASGLSNGYYVNTNFSVPEVPAGTYTFWLRDVAVDQDSSQENFQVQTNETITAVPAQMQEGSSTVLAVKVTGGVPGTSYVANVSVVLPSPLSTQYSQIVSVGTADQNGTASTQVTFPSSSFQPSGSLTDYAGSYTAYFNESSATPAQTTFSVGFLDSITYHRGQTATILAIGYQPNQAATLTVTVSLL